MTDPLLTSLCAICHIQPHNYRCPRCFVLTCSLPCIRRHKQWAQCSGLRDPTAYVKRAELATSKMIDHDYNYLTSLEREFDKADRDATARGYLLDEISHNGRATKGTPLKGEVRVKEALERCGVIVARAPKGMSRAKANHTRWIKEEQHLIWTVQWIHPDGRKEERECAEDQQISEAYAEACKPKPEYVPRKRRRTAKEKVQGVQVVSTAPPDSENIPEETYIQESAQQNHEALTPSHVPPIDNKVVSPESSSIGTIAISSQLLAMGNIKQDRELLQNVSTQQEGPSKTPQTSSPIEFYLHSPSLPSKEIVLIPLEQSATLACSLRNRLVLEFPTIYVFKASDEEVDGGRKIPEGFIIEEDFIARAKHLLVEEIEDGEILDIQKENHKVEDKDDIDVFGRDFDAERVLKVLGEDLKSFG